MTQNAHSTPARVTKTVRLLGGPACGRQKELETPGPWLVADEAQYIVWRKARDGAILYLYRPMYERGTLD